MKAKDKKLLRQPWIGLSKRRTENGIEKLCPRCCIWKPHTDDFFSFITTLGHYHSYCKDCHAEIRAEARRRQKESRAIPA